MQESHRCPVEQRSLTEETILYETVNANYTNRQNLSVLRKDRLGVTLGEKCLGVQGNLRAQVLLLLLGSHHLRMEFLGTLTSRLMHFYVVWIHLQTYIMFAFRKKDIQKIKMNTICLKFDIVIISSITKMRVFGGWRKWYWNKSRSLPAGSLTEPGDGGHTGLSLVILAVDSIRTCFLGCSPRSDLVVMWRLQTDSWPHK